jgi:hypothetical protein
MEPLKQIISDIRVFLYGGIRTLPLTLAGTLLVLGLMTANYAALFFLVGFLILVPLSATILNSLIDTLTTVLDVHWFKATTGDVCNMTIPYITSTKNTIIQDKTTIFSSIWVSMIAFFSGYMITNALELYNRQSFTEELDVKTSDSSDIEQKENNRKSQALIALFSIIIFTIVIVGFRYYTGCENIAGMGLTTILFGSLGMSWFKALGKIGEDRLSDLFGIANRLLPPSAIENAPVACIPIRM